jgi:hypothetical protein
MILLEAQHDQSYEVVAILGCYCYDEHNFDLMTMRNEGCIRYYKDIMGGKWAHYEFASFHKTLVQVHWSSQGGIGDVHVFPGKKR